MSERITVAASAGFCSGVRRAVQIVEEQIRKNPGSICTLGPIVHNPQVLEYFAQKGVRVAERVEDISPGELVVIRSHGVSPSVYEALEERNAQIVDATCPSVLHIHRIVERYTREGIPVIIVGEREHPEVIGTAGWAADTPHIVCDEAEARALHTMERACVVAQTTIALNTWERCVQALKERIDQPEIFNTVCSATSTRQTEAVEIAKNVDILWVIGGRNSSNTKRLYQLCQAHCDRTFAIETAEDIPFYRISTEARVGVVAGASTPDWIIKEVVEKMSQLDENKGFVAEQEAEVVTPVMEETAADAATAVQEQAPEVPAEEASAAATTEEAVSEAAVSEEAAPEETVTEEAVADAIAPAETMAEEVGSEQAAPVADNSAEVEDFFIEQEGEMDSDHAEYQSDADGSDEVGMEDFEIRSLRSGQILRGIVISIEGETVYVNVGYKADGVLTLDEAGLHAGETLKDVFQEGQEIEVKILRINDGDGNVVLSRKALMMKKVWEELKEDFDAGTVLSGVCREAVKGGVIVRFKGERVFIPASQLDLRFVDDINVFVDQTLTFRLIDFKVENQRGGRRRLRLVGSRRVVLEEEEQKKRQEMWSKYEVGQHITGIVKRLTNFGAFVDIGGVDGLIHVSDLAWNRVGHPKEIVSEEQEVEVVVLGVNADKGKISLGYKQLRAHPWDNIEQKYPVGELRTGKVVRITNFGAFVELEKGVDGLVHVSQVANYRVEKIEDVLSIGQEVNVKILDVKPEEQRISLSIRATLPSNEHREFSREGESSESASAAPRTGGNRSFGNRESRDFNNRDSFASRAPRRERPRPAGEEYDSENRSRHERRASHESVDVEGVNFRHKEEMTFNLGDMFADALEGLEGLDEVAEETATAAKEEE